jgi:hypothetical protein
MDRFSGDFIQFELQKELQHKKQSYKPTVEPTQQVFDKVYLDLKDLTLVNLVMERAKYGFDPDWDVCRLQCKALELDINLLDKEEKEVIKLEVKPIQRNGEVEIDESVKQWFDENAIKTYAIISGKTKITLEDLPYISKCRR